MSAWAALLLCLERSQAESPGRRLLGPRLGQLFLAEPNLRLHPRSAASAASKVTSKFFSGLAKVGETHQRSMEAETSALTLAWDISAAPGAPIGT